jgi:hypothetical protein
LSFDKGTIHMSTTGVSNLSSSSSSLRSSSSNGSAQSLEDEESEEGDVEQHDKESMARALVLTVVHQENVLLE